MILVDTNVWSELVRPEPDKAVLRWESANATRLWLSTVVVGELLSGVEWLPRGNRREQFRATYDEMLRLHSDRIVPFDLDAARCYGTVLAIQKCAGRNPGTADTQIAATALVRGMALATRNTQHFEGLGLHLIDPWVS